jgi:hypothetical protein
VWLLLVDSCWRQSSWAITAQLRLQQKSPVSRLTTDTLGMLQAEFRGPFPIQLTICNPNDSIVAYKWSM